MANPDHLRMLEKGVKTWNKWRSDPDNHGLLDLSGSNLSCENLDDIILFNVDLEGANLEGTQLQGANLNSTYIINANLRGADLRFASLCDLALIGSDFYGAEMGYTYLSAEWVGDEVEAALEKEEGQGGKVVLFPLRLDDSVMEIKSGWPAKVRRTRHIGDFSDWKNHDSYKKAFERLMRDLKAGG